MTSQSNLFLALGFLLCFSCLKAQPTPAESACADELLHANCGHETKTECEECVKSHSSELKNCTTEMLEKFCDTTPPSNMTCLHELITDCGADRRNRTMCLKCVEEHEEDLKKAHCITSEVDKFCTMTPPPPGPAECLQTLARDCDVDKKDPTKCMECAREHGASVHCTMEQEEEFCHSGSHNTTCARDLEADCGADRHNKTLCLHCIAEHASTLEKAGCTREECYEFCEGTPPPPPPSPECEKVMSEYCEEDKKNRTLCIKCLAKHANQTRAAHCTYTQEEEFCRSAPPSPPSRCPEELERECESAKREGSTECLKCVEEHNQTLHEAGCTRTEEEEFCRPTPGPSDNCTHEFLDLCGREAHNRTECFRCAVEHNVSLRDHGCTVEEIHKLCNASTPEPSAKCMEVLEEDCTADRENKTKCLECARMHEKQDDCTSSEVDSFCHVTRRLPLMVEFEN
eukprot:m.162236 g.162236  ORF g.162236 m.162236 type:complete len:458 (+) comp15199_c0_seq2:170-1543(+)